MTDRHPAVDVAVVGGGPVGVTAALLLAQRGLSTVLLERSETIYDLPRAVGMDGEIQRVFQNAGLNDWIRANTTPIAGAEFVDAGGNRIVGGDFAPDMLGPQGHPPMVMYHQPWLEAMLRAEAAAAGVELRLGCEVTGLAQDQDGVTVRTDAGAVAATWVVAADGAASPTRKRLGVAFVDQGFDQDWLVFDVALNGPARHLPRLAQQICDPARPTTFVPGHANFCRWELQLQPGESADEMTEPDRVWQLISRWLDPDEGELRRAVVYRFHATVAERMRIGRVFLAGDAAHQMPPFLGQGLCSGIRDAANLAWKLDLVQRGLVADTILDSYDAERRPHAVDMVSHAVDTGRLIDELSGRAASTVDGDSEVRLQAGYGGGREFPHLRHGIRVGDHRRLGKPVLQPIADGRFFDERLGPGFAVLVHDRSAVTDDVVAAWASVGGRVVAVPEGSFGEEVPEGGAVVVRPDRYIAAVAERLDDLPTMTTALLRAMGARR